ncbi:hypothetical protein FACS189491_00130 [Spirochaetia bacterium]|nr:hypothetical protein FACS189491_00130 [Spirochaetia bacterium]
MMPVSHLAKSGNYEIIYSIYDETENLVYRYTVVNNIYNAQELFYIDDNVFEMKTPEFSWDGKDYDDVYVRLYEKNIVTEIAGGKEYKYVQDGEYKLFLEIKTGADEKERFEILQEYTIIVDTRPDDFELASIISSDVYYIYGKGTADTWTAEILNTKTGEQFDRYEFHNTLSVFPDSGFCPTSEGWIVQVKTKDRADNESEPKTLELKPILPVEPVIVEKIAEVEKIVEVVPVMPLLFIIEGERRYIDTPDITFLPFKTSYLEPGNSLRNREYIKILAASILSEIDEGKIKYLHIDGYAFPTKLNDSRQALQTEHDEVLKPMSLARAEDVKDMLVLLGVPVEKIQIRGLGGSYAIDNPKVGANKSRRVRLWVE